MNILFFSPVWNAPSELWMGRMLNALFDHVRVITICDGPQTRWRNIPVFNIERRPILPQPRVRRTLQKLRLSAPPQKPSKTDFLRYLVEAYQIDCAFVNYLDFGVQLAPVLLESRVPIYVHAHGYDITFDLRKHTDPNTPVFAPEYVEQARDLSSKAVLIANSESTAHKLINAGIRRDSVVVKPYGVQASALPPKRPEKMKPLKLLFLGRLVDFKGPDLVIQAFNLAVKMGFRGELIIAGDGPLRVTCELMKANADTRDRITILGPVDEATGERLRQQADVFVAHNRTGPLTRQEEAFGVSLIEAMATGLPVITGRSGSTPEVVGEAGILVEPGDVEAFADALVKLEQNPDLRYQLGYAGWMRVRSCYSIEHERSCLRKILKLPD